MPAKTLSTMSADAFREWRSRCNLSLTGAAQALGVGRSRVAVYQNGDEPIPRTVALACWAVEQGAPLEDVEE